MTFIARRVSFLLTDGGSPGAYAPLPVGPARIVQ